MINAEQAPSLSRRKLLLSVGQTAVGVAAMVLVPGALVAKEKTLEQAMQELIGDTKGLEGLLELDLPQIAENGNTVPIGITVESPMTADDHVKSVHLFAAGNPRPDVASFHFTPACGEASCATRMRLAKTQDIIAAAEMSNGDVYMSKTQVKVTIGGCGG